MVKSKVYAVRLPLNLGDYIDKMANDDDMLASEVIRDLIRDSYNAADRGMIKLV